LRTADTLDSQGTHQPLHGASRNIFAVSPQNVPNLARAVEFAVVRPGPIDLDPQGGIRLCPARRPLRIARNGAPVIISVLSAELLRNSPAG